MYNQDFNSSKEKSKSPSDTDEELSPTVLKIECKSKLFSGRKNWQQLKLNKLDTEFSLIKSKKFVLNDQMSKTAYTRGFTPSKLTERFGAKQARNDQ